MAAKKTKVAKPRRKPDRPVKFVTVEQAFKPQVKVVATRDFSGWADRQRRIKWHIGKGKIGCIDEDKAREFAIKGYVEILDGTIKPYSEDEAAEILSTVTTIGPGVSNG
jgi:hypothetical protein